nr:protein-L-isoaspartate carboxylmethyltransferase [Actinomycetales bacterium]
HLVGPGGGVWGVERIPELQEGASSAVVHWPWAEVRLAHAEVLGLPEHGAFDRILVSAEARREVPEELVAQLAIGGVMVIPVRGQMLRVVRREAGDPEITRHGWYTFVPLVTP